jgi:hypothetical protein
VKNSVRHLLAVILFAVAFPALGQKALVPLNIKSHEIDIAGNASKKSPYTVWLDATAFRVMQMFNGSGVVWGQQSGTILSLTAQHVPRESISERMLPAYQLPLNTRGAPSELVGLSPLFFPPKGKRVAYEDLAPEKDFVISRVTNMTPEKLSSLPGWETHSAKAGEPILIMGYPIAGAGQLWYAVGRVVDESQVKEKLKGSSVRFDSETQFLVDVPCIEGMSGGGAFDRYGRLVGILVRSSGKAGTIVLRTSHIANVFTNSYGARSFKKTCSGHL